MASRTFFPRGDGPLISFLIPTRGRPESIQHAIKTAYNLAKDKNSIEFLVRTDDDNEVTNKLIPNLEYHYKDQIKFIVGPRGNGYADLHLMVNELAAQAKGDWLLLFADDAEIVTPNWDQVVLNLSTFSKPIGVQDVCLLLFDQEGDPNSYSFCALRRKAFELLGYYSPFPHCDLWLFNLMNCLDAIIRVPVTVRHKEQVIDGIRQEGIDSVVDIWREMKTVGAINKKLNAAYKLSYHIDGIHANIKWMDKPTDSGWYWWRKDQSTPERPMLVFKQDAKVTMLGKCLTIINGEAIGPKIGSDRESVVNKISEIGGEWGEMK